MIASKVIEFLDSAIEHFNNNSYKNFEKNLREYEIFYSTEHSNWTSYIYDFLDSWLDAWNHEWQYHEPIEKNDWVTIAGQLRNSIKSNKKFQPIKFKNRILDVF